MWINRIMQCVILVKYHVLFNGQPKGNTDLTRGLRQGDPLYAHKHSLAFLIMQRAKAKKQGCVFRALTPLLMTACSSARRSPLNAMKS